MFGAVSDKLKEVLDGLIEGFMTDFKEGFEQGLYTLKQLVFGQRDGLVWSTFEADNLTLGLNPIYYSMMMIAGFVLILGIVITGMRITSSSLIPQRRNEFFESSKDLILVALLLFNLPLIYDLLFAVNGSLINFFSGAMDSNLDNILDSEADRETGVVAWVFIQLILLGLALWANFYYMMRKLTLIILMGLGPVMVVMWMFPQYKVLTGAWFRELVGSIFIQSIHALVFWLMAVISASSNGFIETVILYVIFIPVSEAIRNLLKLGGDMQGGLSKAGAMMGMASIAGMYGATRGALKGQSVMGSLNEAYRGAKGAAKGAGDGAAAANKDIANTLGAGAGSDTGTSTRAEKMLKAGDFLSRGGKATLGMAGAVAGAGLGPIGAMAGASIGSEVGGVVGSVAGRTGAAGVLGIADRIQKGAGNAKNKLNESLNAQSPDLGNEISDTVAKSNTATWAAAHKDQVMSNLKDKFPDATPQQLENKFADIQNRKFADYKKKASTEWNSASAASEGMGQSGEMVDNYAKGMANQWGDSNKEKFNEEYQRSQPQRPGESNQSFLSRRGQAFNDKKAAMEDTFRNAGMEIVQANKAIGSEAGQKEFATQMQNTLKQMPNVKNADAIVAAGAAALLTGKHKPVDSVMNDSADAMTKAWSAGNKESFIEEYKQANPQGNNETSEMYNSRAGRAFTQKQAEMRKSFQDQAKEFGKGNADNLSVTSEAGQKDFATQMQSNLKQMPNVKNADAIVAAGTAAILKGKSKPIAQALNDSANAMTNAWTAENKESFIEGYKQANPQGKNESTEMFNNRAGRAFTQKQAEMRNGFQTQTREFAQGQANNSLVHSDGFKNSMKTKLVSEYGLGDKEAEEITTVGQKAAAHVTGQNMLAPNGVPNGKRIVQQLAHTRTQNAENAYVNSLVGIPKKERAEAIQNWRANEAPKIHSQAVQELTGAGVVERVNAIPSLIHKSPSALTQAAIGSTAFVTGATGLRHVPQVYQAVSRSVGVGVEGFKNSRLENNNQLVALKDGFVSGGQTIGQTITEARGGGVESYRKDQGNAAFVGGMLLGQRGHEIGANLATKTSLFRGAASQEIHTASEAIQMARTITDDQGNVRVAPGAIRQVIKPNESYVEVQTKSGDIQRVSRMSAGHSGLKSGDIVYQDLDVQDDMIVPVRGKNGSTGTYRVDSGGAKVPSDIQVNQNPNTLFNRPVGKAQQQFGQQQAPVLPAYNQRVDGGQFYVEDLKAQGLENPQLIVEKGRQFVTAQKGGQTYRVSPIHSGDTRLDTNETVTIPVQVMNNTIQPTNVGDLENTVFSRQSKVRNPSSRATIYEEVVDGGDFEYSSSGRPQQLMTDLLPSKHQERVHSSLERRKALDEGRRKQGLLG